MLYDTIVIIIVRKRDKFIAVFVNDKFLAVFANVKKNIFDEIYSKRQHFFGLYRMHPNSSSSSIAHLFTVCALGKVTYTSSMQKNTSVHTSLFCIHIHCRVDLFSKQSFCHCIGNTFLRKSSGLCSFILSNVSYSTEQIFPEVAFHFGFFSSVSYLPVGDNCLCRHSRVVVHDLFLRRQ